MDDDTHTHILGVGGVGDNQQNLNDLQSYLVNFNKEIGVHGEPGSTFSVSQIISQASHQPVFVTVPVSSETSTPDEEQLPVISGIKDGSKTPDIDSTVNSTDTETDNGDHNIYTEMDGKHSPLETVVVDSQIDSLDSGRIQLQELNLDQLGLQTGIAVSDGMIMLPMGDASSILAPSADHKLAQVQIVTINGQPTLQLVGDPNILQQQLNSVTGGVTESHTLQSIVPTSSIQTLIDSTGTSPIGVLSSADTSNSMAVLASVSANTVHQSQLHNIHTLPATDTPQLVTLQEQTDGSHPQVMALSYNNLVTAAGDATTLNQAQNTVDLLKKTNGGFQSVAILPSGDGTQDGEVNYVLIVNPAGDKSNVSGQMYDFGDNLTGEVVEEMTDETGATQRLVKINQLLSANQIQHNREMPGDLLSCTHCDYTSNKKYLLSRHMKSHCDDRPHKCGMCTKGFKSVSSLQNHLNTHTGVRPHKCRVCESAFTTSGELIRHIRYKHTFEKPHKCTECEYASVELSKLKRHMRSHTGERPYACCYCNYASPDTYKLKRHLRIHTGEKPYECDVCHAKFTQSNSLKAHKLIHSGNKPVFKCALCPATCGRKTDLKIHMQKLHSTDQTLVCKKCGETFSDRYSLKVHFKSHEGEKCFKCVECDYSATTQRHVDAHMMIHSGLKPFECEDCDLTFRLKKLLKRHRVMYHNPNYVSSEDKTDEPDCQACEMLFIKKNTTEQSNIEIENNMKDSHTCGGYPKSIYLSQVDPITPLTADQLIENSLLADMKEGKLGTSPKVVVVHPDGRVEEVTAKLQSLSQTKPNETMEDFLVSLGVSGETQFDQVSSLPGDVCVTEVQTLVSGKDNMHFVKHCKEVTEHNDITSSIETQSELESNSFTVSGIVPGLVINTDQTKEESTQASFDSDDDIKKVKILPQEPFLQLTSEPATDTTDLGDCFEDSNYKIDSGDQTVLGTTSQNITMVTMLQSDENRSLKRPAGDSMDDHHVNKSLKTDTTLPDV